MKRFPLVLVFCAAPALAQITVTPGEPTASPTPQQTQAARPNGGELPVRRAVPVKKATPAPSPTPAVKRKPGGFFGFFRRLFGGGASEKPAATPTPVVKSKPTPKAKPTATPTHIATPSPTATPVPSVTPKPTPRIPAPTPAPTGAAGPATVIPQTMSTTAGDDRYLQLKERALKDAHVAALLQKMNSQPEGGDAYKTAAHEYLTALFAKMRKLDSSYEEALNRKEGAYRRRIDEGKTIVE